MTPVLNNGIFLREAVYEIGSSVDSYHLTKQFGSVEPTDLGPIDLWALYQKVDMPLYQLSSFGGKNVKVVDHPDGEYKWQVPIVNDLPFIVENIEAGKTQPGMDETVFRIKLNKRAFSHGHIITYDKFNGVELYVTADDIMPTGDGFVYTVQLVNNENTRFMDPKYLAPGTKYFAKSSVKQLDYGERYTELGQVRTGWREFMNFVGQNVATREFGVSTKAELMMRNKVRVNGVPVQELWSWKKKQEDKDISIASLDDLVAKKGVDYVKSAMKDGTLSRSFVTDIEANCLTEIAKDIENNLMWGRGGRIGRTDGPDDIRMSAGLWAQLELSPRRVYNRGQFTLDLFRTELMNFYGGKVDFKGPDPQRRIVVQTGLAGMKMVSEAIEKKAMGINMQINGDKSGVGAISGKAMNLHFGYAFTSFTIPFLANVEFVLNPAFDPVQTNSIENPVIDGYPLSSYSFVIFDVTDQGNDNIFLLKSKLDEGLRWSYANGSIDYLGRNGHQRTGNFSGYKVFMEQMHQAVKIMDPSRVLKIVMRNPVSGKTL